MHCSDGGTLRYLHPLHRFGTQWARRNMRTVRRRKASVDHRTRVGQARRARTQARIIAAALRVFTEHGPQDPPVIDDFIRAAGVARGTFYNYYKSVGELLEATRKWLEDDFIESIEAEVASL